MAADFSIRQGDSQPTLTCTIKDGSGTAIDVSGCSVRFQMRKADATLGVLTVDAAASFVTDGTNGQVFFTLTPAQTAIAGDYLGQFKIIWSAISAATFQTVPSAGYLAISITPKL